MRVAIVGAGIHGLSTAWTLAKGGHQVTLLEQGPLPNPMAASGDQHRLIRRSYGPRDGYARMMPEAFAAWDALWEDLGVSHFANTGILALTRAPGDGGHSVRDSLTRNGVGFETLAPEAAAERFPYLDPAGFDEAYYTPEGGALLCQKIAAGLRDWLLAHGVDLRIHTAVAGVEAAAGLVRLASGEVIEADRVVVSAGAWVKKLLPELDLPLRIHRTHSIYLQPPEHLRADWERAPGILTLGGSPTGYILPPLGGTELKFASAIGRVPTDDPDAQREATPGLGLPMQALLNGPLAGGADAYPITRVSTCAYTFTSDEAFFTHWDRRLAVISPCSGHGYKFGAAVGRRLAAALETGDEDGLRSWLRGES